MFQGFGAVGAPSHEEAWPNLDDGYDGRHGA